MALDSRAVTVTTTATRLDTASETDNVAGSSLLLHNNGSVTVFLGHAAVTAAIGMPLLAGDKFSADLELADGLYGIVSSGTADVRVLEVGV